MVTRPFTVGVIGGGTAGYLTALALNARCARAEVTLIEASDLGPIGVGEGTTPVMLPFLHGYLGLDLATFVAEVQPTWKLGVRLDWGRPDGGSFMFPFAASHLTDSYAHEGTINHAGYISELMNRSAGVHAIGADLSTKSLVGSIPFAYHLDNRRFVSYLNEMAKRQGVRLIDAHLIGHTFAPDGDLESVIAKDGRRFAFDLFVDCTEFRSELLGKALGVGFNSKASNLLADTALVGPAPHINGLDPYTRSDTLDAGWCWSVPQLEDDRRGYVYSSAHLSEDEAEEEMRRHCPGLGEVRPVRFKSGRYAQWWSRNVVAIGNSYGFVEPLQATALHMIVHEVTVLVEHLVGTGSVSGDHTKLNRHIGTVWDDVCTLINLHYRYNYRRDTPFWKDARAASDLGSLEGIIDEVVSGRSLSDLIQTGNLPMHTGVSRDIDLVLLGLQTVRRDRRNAQLSERDWNGRKQRTIDASRLALPAAASVELARVRPETIDASAAPWYKRIEQHLEHPLGHSSTTGHSFFLLLPEAEHTARNRRLPSGDRMTA